MAIMVTHKIIPVTKISVPIAIVINFPVNLNIRPTNAQINKIGQKINMPKKCNISLITLSFKMIIPYTSYNLNER